MNSLLQTAWSLGAIVPAQAPAVLGHGGRLVIEAAEHAGRPDGSPDALGGRDMYQMWKSGVTVGTWFLLQDEPKSTPFQSGLYLRSTSARHAVAKPLLTPFSFPFVAYLKSLGKVHDLGARHDERHAGRRDPGAERPGRSWKTVATITSNSYGIFTGDPDPRREDHVFSAGHRARLGELGRVLAHGSAEREPQRSHSFPPRG